VSSNEGPADVATYAASLSVTGVSPNFGFSLRVQPYVDSVGGAMKSGVASVGSWDTH
jgi:hypothetical protein